MNSADLFEAIVSEHYDPLLRFALSLTRTEADARDLTQHTFQVWATRGCQLRDRTKVKPWLYTTLHRAFLRGRRAQSRFPHEDLEEVGHQLPAVPPVLPDPLEPLPVVPAIARLDEAYQAAVSLYYLESHSYREIALLLGVPIGTVKSRIARGLAQLREILGRAESRASTPRGTDGRDGPLVPVGRGNKTASPGS